MEVSNIWTTMPNLFSLAFEGLAFTVLVATLVTSLTPTKADDARLDRVLGFLNMLAGNVGHNRNADDK